MWQADYTTLIDDADAPVWNFDSPTDYSSGSPMPEDNGVAVNVPINPRLTDIILGDDYLSNIPKSKTPYFPLDVVTHPTSLIKVPGGGYNLDASLSNSPTGLYKLDELD